MNSRLRNSETKRLKSVLRISQAVSRTFDLEKILMMACEMTTQVIKADRCSIALLSTENTYKIVKSYKKKASYPSIDGLKFDLKDYPHIAPFILKGKSVNLSDHKKLSLSVKERTIFKQSKVKALLAVPIIAGRKTIGAIVPSRIEEPSAFSSQDLSLCQTIANQVGIAINNTNLIEELENKHKQQTALLDINSSISKASDLPHFFKIVTQKVSKFLKIERSAAILFDLSRRESVLGVLYSKGKFLPKYEGFQRRLDDFPVALNELKKKGVFYSQDISRSSISLKEKKILSKDGYKSILVVPFSCSGNLVGYIALGTLKEHRKFIESEISFTKALADHLSIVIQNARLMEELGKKDKEQRILLEISKAISGILNQKELFKIITKKTADLLELERCGIILVDEIKGEVNHISLYFKDRHQPEHIGIWGTIEDFPRIYAEVENGQVFHTSEVAKSILSAREKKIFAKHGIKSILITPFLYAGKFQGLLALSTVSKKHNFTESEISLSRAIANQLAVAVENTQLVKTLEEEHEELRVSRQEAQLAHERLRYLMFSTSAVIYAAETSGDYGATFITDNVQSIFGYSPEKFIKNSNFWIDHIYPDDRSRILSDLSKIFDKRNHCFEYRFLCKDGKYKWVRDEMKMICDNQGKPLEIIGYWEDITERKRTEMALLESENRYRRLFEDSPISLWEEDFSDVRDYLDSLKSSGVKNFRKFIENHPEEIVRCATMVKVVAVNRTTLKLYKAKSIDELREGLNRVFGEESYNVFKEELIAIAKGKTVFESDAITQTLEGEKIHIILKWTAVPGFEKTLSKVLVSIIDITERKLAQEQLAKLANRVIQAQEEEKKNISSRLHDVVIQDLAAIQMELKMAQQDPTKNVDQVKGKLNEGEKLLSITLENLRDLTSDLRPRILDDLGLFSAIRWYVDKFRRRTNLELKLKITGSPKGLSPKTETTVFRIIQEGLTNVAKHSKATIASLSLSSKAKHISIVIQDNGIGFEPGRAYSPTSFGLLRIKENTHLLGGKFNIISKKGKGTKLDIVFPSSAVY